jgi:chromosomal replication initiation ATPase DnaA
MKTQPNLTQSDVFISMMKEQPKKEFNPYETLLNYLNIYVKECEGKEKKIKESILNLRIEYIKRVVCNYHLVTFEQINNESRERDTIEIKQFIQFFCRMYAKATYKRIGNVFSYKRKYWQKEKGIDHTTVISNERKIQDLIETDRTIAAKYKDITAIIENDINNGIIRF